MDNAQVAGVKRPRRPSCSRRPIKRSKYGNEIGSNVSALHSDTSQCTLELSEHASATQLHYDPSSPSLEQLADVSTLSSYINPKGVSAEKQHLPQALVPCPAVVPCSDPECEDILPCSESADWCKTLECLGEICYDRDCHYEHDLEEICCDEPCPDRDHCQSPCYSQDCGVPTCDSPCPESHTGPANYAGSQATDGYFESAALICGCVDPKCLEMTGHWHCHDPHHKHCPDFFESSLQTTNVQQPVSDARYSTESRNLPYYTSQPSLPNTNFFHAQDQFFNMFDQANAHSYDNQTYGSCYSMVEAPATPALTNTSSATPATTASNPSVQVSQSLDVDFSCRWSFAPADSSGPLHVCGQHFDTAEELHKHVEKTHIEGLPREDNAGNGFYCRWEGCDRYLCRSFQARPKLKRHMQTHTLFKPFICSQCGVQMKTKDAMEKHERTHTGERPYRCQVVGCASTFATSTELKTHMVVHSGEKPHQCPICGESFADSSNLSKHKKTHFVGMYKCPDCGARMKRWDQMRRHIVTQNHAMVLMEDKRAQHEYKARMEREFRELPDEEKALRTTVAGDKGEARLFGQGRFRGGLLM